jgi:hypothetical protein
MLSMLFFGFTATFSATAADVAGPPAPIRTTAPATSCAPGDPACAEAPAKPAQPARPAPAAPKPAPAAPKPAPARPPNNDSSGGVAPGTGTTGPGGGSIPAPSENPAFVEEDPTLSGGVSPDQGEEVDSPSTSPLTVPNFLINNFEIPPFLLPIYQACGSEYGIPWQVLAAINRIETEFGTNLNTSYAGAQGWMQFMPGTWEAYGVDANGDRLKDPYNPVDAICAAGNYLSASGYAEDPSSAIFAYNRADWYVKDILANAAAYSQIPTEMISALTGLTEGARFPVAAEKVDYEGKVSARQAKRDGTESQDVSSDENRRSIEIEAEGGSPVIAVNDSVVRSVDRKAGTVVIEDAYGNRYSYAGLGSVATVHPVPRRDDSEGDDDGGAPPPPEQAPVPDGALDMGDAKAQDRPEGSNSDPKVEPEGSGRAGQPGADEISEVLSDPDAAEAAAAEQAEPEDPAGPTGSEATLAAAEDRRAEQAAISGETEAAQAGKNTENMRGRVYANPLRPQNQQRATVAGQSVSDPMPSGGVEGKPGDYVIYDGSASGIFRFDKDTTDLKPLIKGSRVIAGTVLGRLAEQPTAAITFSIQPGGEDTPQIDPKPFLDGWTLLAETNIYNAKGKNRFADRLGVGGVLLLSKSALQRRVLSDPKVSIGECDRQYIANGAIDRRVLATLAFITQKGYDLLITSMLCGREVSITTSGYTSNHSYGAAIDIAAINGEVVTSATQGPGSLTDLVAREVLSLQGTMAPDEVISLIDYPAPAGFAMSDHDDHLHVGFRPAGDSDLPGGSIRSTLGAEQWRALTERLGEIRNPEVPTKPSPSALKAEGPDKGNRN